ncbi:MAG: hypothetical protein Q4C63_05865, partial [Eubacteriales bacterium]|nr:hypothetical protein [Eubacteriales bacterium]
LRLLLIRRMYELRMLVIEGEYTERPEGTVTEEVLSLWKHAECAGLSLLYGEGYLTSFPDEAVQTFCRHAGALFKRMVPCKFKTLEVLQEFS